ADEVVVPAQQPDIAWGRPDPDEPATWLHLVSPTPGTANDPTGVTALGGVTFSRPAGSFRDSFQLTLATITEGATIKYTTNGRVPGLFAGATFENPLTVDKTTHFRAGVFLGSKLISPLTDAFYFAVDPGLESFSSDLPVALIHTGGHDFRKDSGFDPPLTPVSSLFVEGSASERASLTNPPDFIGRAGMNVRGASSREWPKKQFKFETWNTADDDESVSLLGFPEDADWILAAPYFDKSLIRNHLTFRWWESLGYDSPRTRFFELFLDSNGDDVFTMEDYEGIYVLTEKIEPGKDRVDVPPIRPVESAPGTFTGGFIAEGTNVNQQWVSRKGIRMKLVEPKDSENRPEEKAWFRSYFDEVEAAIFSDTFDDPETGYRRYLDLPSHIDYDIMREISRNIDGASTFFSIREDEKIHMGPLWDYNQAYGLTRLFEPNPGWKTDGWNVEYMTNGSHWLKWWLELEKDSDYQTAWNDRWVALRETLLSNEKLFSDIAATAALLEESQQRNFTRWDILGRAVWSTGGSTRADPGETDRTTYGAEIEFVRSWLEARLAWIDAQVPGAPTFNQAGGAVAKGFPLEISLQTPFRPVNGQLVYTTDGTDPRLPGGR
ncbi:MAG: CotH kinase family protein, partial [Verrucomicrobiota bacterium]